MTKPQEYIIKPLAWEFVAHIDRWDAGTIFCRVHVEKDGDLFYWSYCVDEYYDEGRHECESFEDGKRQAESWYLSRLLPALEPAGC